MSKVTFKVYGMPGPQGSKAFKGIDSSGHAILVESSKAAKPWRQDVYSAAREAIKSMDGKAIFPMDGPLVGRMIFTWPKPASAPKRRPSWPIGKPDLSKFVRSTEDALKTSGFIRDDARIIGYSRLWKTYPNEDPEALDMPGAIITVMHLVDYLDGRLI